MVSCWDEGERESRETEGGSAWMKKERGKVRMSNGDTQPKTHSPTHPITLIGYMQIHPPMHLHTQQHTCIHTSHATQSMGEG